MKEKTVQLIIKIMRKLFVILGIVAPLFWSACSGEDDLTPSDVDRNWWVNVDSEDPLDHKIYEIYEQYGVPIFYNDTIGEENRGKDAFGNPLTYYEVIKLTYTIMGGTTSDAVEAKYTLSFNREDIENGVEFLQEYVLAKMPDFVTPPKSYLLVDTLWMGILDTTRQEPYSASAYAGMTAVAVGKLSEIKNMTEEEKLLFGGEVLAVDIASTIEEKYDEELDEKFLHEIKTLTQYSGFSYGAQVKVTGDGIFTPNKMDYREYGFLNKALDKPSVEGESYYFPLAAQDVADFVALCLGFTEEEVIAAYGQFEHIMNKYYYMMEILDLLKTAGQE